MSSQKKAASVIERTALLLAVVAVAAGAASCKSNDIDGGGPSKPVTPDAESTSYDSGIRFVDTGAETRRHYYDPTHDAGAPGLELDAAGGSDIGGEAPDSGLAATDGAAYTDPCAGPSLPIGCNCEDDLQCESGVCYPVPGARVCVDVCLDGCADGFLCVPAGPGPDQTHICVPEHNRLCQPCRVTSDCEVYSGDGSECVPYGDEGRFCGTSCQVPGDCPDGYSCQEVLSDARHLAKQCVLDEGVCECTDVGLRMAVETPCAIHSGHGQCAGTRSCGPDGLGDCAAVPAEPESCDGLDNDCDGETDEIPDGFACVRTNTWGSCEGAGVCVEGWVICDAHEPGAEICDGLDQDCDGEVDEGFTDTDGDGEADCTDEDDDGDGIGDLDDNCALVPNPDQADLDGNGEGDVCDDDTDGDGYGADEDCEPENRAVNPGAAEICNGVDDDCSGVVDDNIVACRDGVACTEDRCDFSTGDCLNVPVDAACGDGDPCTADTCDPETGCHYAWADGVVCNDGDLCTEDDLCESGVCAGRPREVCCTADAECDDGDPCTADLCEPGSAQCRYQPSPRGTPCDADGDPCTTGDTCRGVDCLPGPAVSCPDDGGPCLESVCVADSATDYHCEKRVAAGNPPCEDGSACTADERCLAGRCVGTPMDCDDGDPCTADSCQAGACVHDLLYPTCGQPDACSGAPGECEDANPCTADACVAGFCEHTPLVGSCDDGNLCTSGDVCVAGACRGTPMSCDDGNPCTRDACSGGQCNSQPHDGLACDDGDGCTSGDQCTGGSCSGVPRSCSDGNPCTLDSCQGGQCVFQPLSGSACNDSDVCTVGDQCTSGVCRGIGTPRACEGGICYCPDRTPEHCRPGSDWDGDGYPASMDCAPRDGSRYPNAPEQCNGIDDDCDGQIDEGAPCAGGCETRAWGGNVYLFCATHMTWWDANDYCNRRGYTLASINSAAEGEFINAARNGILGYFTPWIGGRMNSDGSWMWMDGSPWLYENWAAGAPGTSGALCAYMSQRTSTWESPLCHDAYSFVCKSGGGSGNDPDDSCPGWLN